MLMFCNFLVSYLDPQLLLQAYGKRVYSPALAS